MKTVRISMPDEVFARLKKLARKERHAGIASLLLARVGEHNEQTETADLVNQAVNLAKRKDHGELFRIRDLLSKKWEDFDKGTRIRAGRQFYARVCSENLGIRPSKKAASGHQYYQRTG